MSETLQDLHTAQRSVSIWVTQPKNPFTSHVANTHHKQSHSLLHTNTHVLYTHLETLDRCQKTGFGRGQIYVLQSLYEKKEKEKKKNSLKPFAGPFVNTYCLLQSFCFSVVELIRGFLVCILCRTQLCVDPVITLIPSDVSLSTSNYDSVPRKHTVTHPFTITVVDKSSISMDFSVSSSPQSLLYPLSGCEPIPVQYVRWGDPEPIAAVVFACLGLMATLFVTSVFIK